MTQYIPAQPEGIRVPCGEIHISVGLIIDIGQHTQLGKIIQATTANTYHNGISTQLHRSHSTFTQLHIRSSLTAAAWAHKAHMLLSPDEQHKVPWWGVSVHQSPV
jgi:hypothetical protein